MNTLVKNFPPILLILITVGLPTPSLSESSGIHTIVAVKGNVTVNKKQWTTPQPASVGLTLHGEDNLTVSPNASVKVYCSNLKQWEVKKGNHQVSIGCPPGQTVLKLPNRNNEEFRKDGKTEEALAKLPYLITPRNSFILTNTPQLRWNKVSDATSYTVTIDGVNWKQEVNNTEIVYSSETPLQAERRYRVTIKTDNGASSPSDPPATFEILAEPTKKTVLEAVETIKQQPLSPAEKGLILAQLYRGYGLYADAVEVLEELVTQGSQQVSVYQLLGDTYLDTGLPQLAKKPYQKALELANSTENLSRQGNIQTGLGKAYAKLGEEEKAVQLLEKATRIYAELGDEKLSQELNETIDSILERN